MTLSALLVEGKMRRSDGWHPQSHLSPGVAPRDVPKEGKVLQRAGFHELSALPGLSGPC